MKAFISVSIFYVETVDHIFVHDFILKYWHYQTELSKQTMIISVFFVETGEHSKWIATDFLTKVSTLWKSHWGIYVNLEVWSINKSLIMEPPT